MKTKNKLTSVLAAILLMGFIFHPIQIQSQNAKDSTKMKNCCMMKEGKMCCVKDGKTMPMEKDMTLKDGTKCMLDGSCIKKDGTKMKMKEGDCIGMDSKMDHCGTAHKKAEKTAAYNCSMHPDIISDKAGKCPKCKMDLIKTK